MKKCFICSPYKGDPQKNVQLAKKYCRDAMWDGFIPVCPHLFFTTFLDDDNSSDRWRGTSMGMALLAECSEVRVFCDEVTEGMIPEIKKAQELKIPVKFYNADMEVIDYDALIINKRIGAGYRKIIADAHGDRGGAGICPYAGDCSRAAGNEEPGKQPEPEVTDSGSTGGGNAGSTRTGFWGRLFRRS